MSDADELRTAAERLEERAARNEAEAVAFPAWNLAKGAAEDRAVAALLRAASEAHAPDRTCEPWEHHVRDAALAVARAVSGDLS